MPDAGASGNLVLWTAVHNQGHRGLAQNGQEGRAGPLGMWGGDGVTGGHFQLSPGLCQDYLPHLECHGSGVEKGANAE